MARYEVTSFDSPLYALAVEACNLSDNSDWSAVVIDPANPDPAQRVRLAADHITGEEVIYWDRGLRADLSYWVNTPHDIATVSAELLEPSNIMTPGFILAQCYPLDTLTDSRELSTLEGRTFQPVIVASYDCDDCRDDEAARDAGQCDHIMGWAMIVSQTVEVA